MKKLARILNTFQAVYSGSSLIGTLVGIVTSFITGFFVWLGGSIFGLVNFIQNLSNITNYPATRCYMYEGTSTYSECINYYDEYVSQYIGSAVIQFVIILASAILLSLFVTFLIIMINSKNLIRCSLIFGAHLTATILTDKFEGKKQMAPGFINLGMGLLYMNYFGNNLLAILAFITGIINLNCIEKEEPKQIEEK